MSWGAKTTVEQRLEFVKQAIKANSNMKLLCERYDISRKNGYKWLARYKADGIAGLSDRSRRPHASPTQASDTQVAAVVKLRHRYPYWGARKLRVLLEREGFNPLPSESGINKILKREGLSAKVTRQQKTYQRFEHPYPNDLWQMDFKGHFMCGHKRCYPLTILDDHSRFLVTLATCPNERGETIKPVIIKTFKRYGLPNRINVDNGNPWGSMYSCARYTTFSLWLMDLGVRVSHSRPRHPQTNGKDERLHRTLKHELLNQGQFDDFPALQQAFNEWREQYNCDRPHEALQMQSPIARYRPSIREYPDCIQPYEYSDDCRLVKPDKRGRLVVDKRVIFVGVPFAGRYLGLRRGDNEQNVKLFYRHQFLGELDLSSIEQQQMINLYSKRILVT